MAHRSRRRSRYPRGGRAVPVLFSDYNIQNPSFAGFVTTQDHGLLEFLLVFNKAS
jgi:hypothetical protein